MPQRLQLKEGDLFRLMPFTDGRVGFGQITHLTGKGVFMLVVFRSAWTEQDVRTASIVQDDVALFAESSDALLYHGHWEVVDNHGVDRRRVPRREFKLMTTNGYVVEDLMRTAQRTATEEEVEGLPYRSHVAPIRVQYAFEALHEQRQWEPEWRALQV